jgi:hypothetical protein
MPVHLVLAAMGLGLAAGTLVLLAAGWSGTVARAALSLSGLAGLTVLTLSAGGRLNLGEATARELWRPQATTTELRQMIETLDTLSSALYGRVRALPVEMADPATPALAWALREYPAADPTGPEGQPPVLLMAEASAAARPPSAYLGQSVVISERWGWTGWWPPDLFRWWIDREAPTVPERWVMFVRPDVAGIGAEAPTGEP